LLPLRARGDFTFVTIANIEKIRSSKAILFRKFGTLYVVMLANRVRPQLHIRIAMAQINPTVGDLEGNTRLIREYCQRAESAGADLVVFPEMAVTGYPPLDLLPPREVRPPAGNRKPGQEELIRLNKQLTLKLAEEIRGTIAVVGFVDYDDSHLFNAAAIIERGKVAGTVHKTLLPTYDVFDELRYFTPAQANNPIDINIGGRQIKLGTSICEDLWDEQIGYGVTVVDALCLKGAQLIVSLNASPFHDKIRDVRMQIMRQKVKNLQIPIFYVNMVGGQDELVFDGQSLAIDASGRLIAMGRQFEEDLIITDVDFPKGTGVGAELTEPSYNREEEMFNALTLGVRDYFRKSGFKGAYVGLSGGIDSSLVAAIAAEALGKQNVTGVSMPSRYSSEHSKTDSLSLARNLEIKFLSVPIDPIFDSYQKQLAAEFKGLPGDVAEENLQSRIRGGILMALSNKFGSLVLATGNKTELALGYATLYGDMSGGLEVIGDVSKTEVYALGRYFNRKAGSPLIPENCFTKIPSAELCPDQFDPFDYAVVSPMVDEIIENRLSADELIKKGFPEQVVHDTLSRVRRAEYKRRQAPPTIKITKKAFGLGWNMPIVNRFPS
jgi:NAD+ synthase (glutamine-hydrolysing)